VVVKTSIRLNGLAGLVITKLDVLTGVPRLKIATGYQCGSMKLDSVPPELDALEACRPNYEELPGWEENITKVRNFSDLPENAKRYLLTIEELAGIPLYIISVGPGRDENIVLRNPFEDR